METRGKHEHSHGPCGCPSFDETLDKAACACATGRIPGCALHRASLTRRLMQHIHTSVSGSSNLATPFFQLLQTTNVRQSSTGAYHSCQRGIWPSRTHVGPNGNTAAGQPGQMLTPRYFSRVCHHLGFWGVCCLAQDGVGSSLAGCCCWRSSTSPPPRCSCCCCCCTSCGFECECMADASA